MKKFAYIFGLICLVTCLVIPEAAPAIVGLAFGASIPGVGLMACSIIDLDDQDDCPDAQGGIYLTYLTECANVDLSGVALDIGGDQIIETITMTGVGLWHKWVYDDDDTAFYNETGERPTGKTHVFNQQAFLKFAGLTNEKRKAANSVKDCCCIVAIHFLNNGTQVVQGIEEDAAGNFRYTARAKAKPTVSILTGTGAEEDRMEATIDSIGIHASYTTSLDAAAIEAL